MLAKGFEEEKSERHKINEYKIKKSLSFGKLGFGKKRVRTIC